MPDLLGRLVKNRMLTHGGSVGRGRYEEEEQNEAN
jgi:hypothetical protein